MTLWHLLRLIGLRHLVKGFSRSMATLLGIAIGVGVLVAITATNRALVASFDGMVESVAGKADLVLGGAGGGLGEEAAQAVTAVPGVAHIAPVIEQMATAPALKDRLLVIGVDLLGDPYFLRFEGSSAEDGEALQDPLSFLNSDNALLVTASFAQRHGLTRGATLDLATPSGRRTFTVYGLINEQGAGAAYGGAVGIMYIGAAQLAFGREGRYDRVDIAVGEGEDPAEVAQRVREALGAGFTVRRPEDLSARTAQMTGLFRQGLQMTSGIALLVGLALIFNTVSLSVLQRRREMGILRAFGATRAQVTRMILLEALVMGACGGLGGVGLGAALARATLEGATATITSMYVSVEPTAARVDLPLAVLGIAVGMATAAVAAWGPARQAGAVAPVQVLRREVAIEAPPRGWLRRRVAWGLSLWAIAASTALAPVTPESALAVAMAAMTLVLMGMALITPAAVWTIDFVLSPPTQRLLGITARLASDNLHRSLARASANVAALAAAIIMVIAIGCYMSSFMASVEAWISDAIPSHLFVTSGARVVGQTNVPMKPSLGEELKTTPGVKYMYQLRIADHTYQGQAVRLLSVEMDIFLRDARPRAVAGPAPTPAALQDRAAPAVMVSESFATLFRVGPGDVIQLETAVGERPFLVSCVIVDYSSNLGFVYLDRGFYVEYWRDELVDAFEFYLNDVNQSQQVRDAMVSKWGADYDLYVLTNAELREEVEGTIRQFFTLTNALTFIAILVALLGIINTLHAEILDRTREIGVLRAVGALRGQVARMIVLEALYMGGAAIMLGTAGGLVVGLNIVQVLARTQTGWSLPMTTPWDTIALTTGLTLSVSGLAGWLPARKAARMNVVDALAWE